jgi:Raf kinase inhibitor-like YbhB/YbcL family protein
MAFTLTSHGFQDGDTIPRRFTCDGADEAPHLTWTDPPDGTDSYALIMDDPDAPSGTFTHWMVYDIPGSARELTHHGDAGKTLANDFGRPGYGGPCPPRGHGPHRYRFTLYAVSAPALSPRGKSRDALDAALGAHTLATASMVGRYQR